MAEQRIVYGMEISLRLRSALNGQVGHASSSSLATGLPSIMTTFDNKGKDNIISKPPLSSSAGGTTGNNSYNASSIAGAAGINTSATVADLDFHPTTAFLYSPGPADPRLLVKKWDDPTRPQSNFDLCVFRIEPAAHTIDVRKDNNNTVTFGAVIHLVHNFSGRYLAVVRQQADPSLHPEGHFQLQLMTKEEAGRACRLRLSSKYKRRAEGDAVVNKDVCYLQYETGALGLNANFANDSLEDTEASAAEELTPFDICVYDNTDPTDNSRQSVLRAGIAALIFHREQDALLITEGKSMSLTQELARNNSGGAGGGGGGNSGGGSSNNLLGGGLSGSSNNLLKHGAAANSAAGEGGGGLNHLKTNGGGLASIMMNANADHASSAAATSSQMFSSNNLRRTNSRKATLVSDSASKSHHLLPDTPFFRRFESVVTNLDPESFEFDCSALWFIDLVDPTVGGPIRTGRPCRLRHGATNKYLCVVKQPQRNSSASPANGGGAAAASDALFTINSCAVSGLSPSPTRHHHGGAHSPSINPYSGEGSVNFSEYHSPTSVFPSSPDSYKLLLHSLDLNTHAAHSIFELELVSSDDSLDAQSLQGKPIFSARSYLRVRHHATGMYLTTRQMGTHSLSITLGPEPTLEDTLAIVVVSRDRQADLTFLMGNTSFLNAYIRLFRIMQKPTSHYKYEDAEVKKVIARTKASLQSLIKFCTESDCDDVLKREGIPISSHQNSMFEVQIHKLALEVCVAPFVSVDALDPYQVPLKGGAIPFSKINEPEYAEVHEICFLVFRLLKQMSKGCIYAAQLLDFFDFMQNMEGYKLRISDTLMEIVANNRAMLRSEDRCRKDIDHNIKLLKNKERSSGYVKYLSLMCVCNEKGMVNNQRYICRQIFEINRGEILLPLLLSKVPKRQVKDLASAKEMSELWSSVLGMNTDEWDPTLRIFVPPPKSKDKNKAASAPAAETATLSAEDQWLSLDVFLREDFNSGDKKINDSRKKIVKFFASSIELLANLCVGLDPECHRKIMQWLPVENIIVALDPSIPYNDSIRANFFNVAHNLIVRRALNDIGRDSHQTHSCGDLVIVESKAMADFKPPPIVGNNGDLNVSTSESPYGTHNHQSNGKLSEPITPFNELVGKQQQQQQGNNGGENIFAHPAHYNRIRHEDLVAVKKLSLNELSNYSRHERLRSPKLIEDYNKLLLSLTSIWHSIVIHEAYSEDELTTAVDSVIRILSIMLEGKKGGGGNSKSSSKNAAAAALAAVSSPASASAADNSALLVVVKTTENNIETLKTKITLIHFLSAVLRHELSRIADTVLHLWAKEGTASNAHSNASATPKSSPTTPTTTSRSPSSSSATNNGNSSSSHSPKGEAFYRAQQELETLRKVRLQEDKLFPVLFELTCHEDQQLVNAALELGTLLCNSGPYVSERIQNAEPIESQMAFELFPYIAAMTSKIKKHISPSGIVVNEVPVKHAIDNVLQHAEARLMEATKNGSVPGVGVTTTVSDFLSTNAGADPAASASAAPPSSSGAGGIRRRRGVKGGTLTRGERPLIARAWGGQLPLELVEYSRLLGRSGLPEILIRSLEESDSQSPEYIELLMDFFNLLLISDEVATRLGPYIDVFSSLLDHEKTKNDAAMIVLAVLRCNKAAARNLSYENIKTLVAMIQSDQSGAISQGLEYITLGQYPIPQNQRQVLSSILSSGMTKYSKIISHNFKEHEFILNRSIINLIACCCVNNSTCRAMVAKVFTPTEIMRIVRDNDDGQIPAKHLYPYYKLLASGFLVCEEEWTASAIKVQKLQWLTPDWWNLVERMLKKLPPHFAYSNGQDFTYTGPLMNTHGKYSAVSANGNQILATSPSLNPQKLTLSGDYSSTLSNVDEFCAPLVFEGIIPCLTNFYRNLYSNDTHRKVAHCIDVTHVTYKAIEVTEWILSLCAAASAASHSSVYGGGGEHDPNAVPTPAAPFKLPKGYIGAAQNFLQAVYPHAKQLYQKEKQRGGGSGTIGALSATADPTAPTTLTTNNTNTSSSIIDGNILAQIPHLIEKLGKYAWKRETLKPVASSSSSADSNTATTSNASKTTSGHLSETNSAASFGTDAGGNSFASYNSATSASAAITNRHRQEVTKMFAEEWSYNSKKALAPLISILNENKMLHQISHSSLRCRQYHTKLINHILSWDLSTEVTISVLASFRIALEKSEDEDHLIEAQNYLNEINMLRVITEISFFQRPDVTKESCNLAIGILEDGNVLVQDSLLQYFLAHDERFFHDVDRMLKMAIEDSEQHRTRVDNASYYRGHDSPLRFPNVECTFRFLQLMCEGHHRGLQDYLHSQRDNLRSCNIIKSVALFSNELTTHMLDYENMKLLSQTLALLIEVCQGPSLINQSTLVTNGVFAFITKILTSPQFLLDIDELQKRSDESKKRQRLKKKKAEMKQKKNSQNDKSNDDGQKKANDDDDDSDSSDDESDDEDELDDVRIVLGVKSSTIKLILALFEGSSDGSIPFAMITQVPLTALADLANSLIHTRMFAPDGNGDGSGDELVCDLVYDIMITMHIIVNSVTPKQVQRQQQQLNSNNFASHSSSSAMGGGDRAPDNGGKNSSATNYGGDNQQQHAVLALKTAQKLLHDNKEKIGLLGRIEIERDEKIERVYFRVPAACSLITDETKNQLFWAIDRSTQGSKLSDFLDKADEVIYDVQWLSDKMATNLYIKHLARFPLKFWDDCSLAFAFIINILFVFVMVDANGLLDKETDWMGIEGCLRIFAYSQLVVTFIAWILDGVLNFPLILYKKSKEINDKKHKKNNAKRKRNGQQQSAVETIATNLSIANGSSDDNSGGGGASNGAAAAASSSLIELTALQKVTACLNRSVSVYRLASFVFSLLGFWYSDFFFAFHLLGTIKKSSVLENVVVAVTQNGRSLLLTGLLGCMFVYLFTIVAFISFRDHFEDNSCESLAGCVLHVLTTGLRQGGGIGDQMTKVTNEQPTYISRVIFDFLFWAFMIVIFLNILFGIIIDTFAELRDEKSKKEEDMRTRCFVCGIDSYTFDRYGDGFAEHEAEEHNVWQYLYFIHHLSRKEPTEYNGQESYVAACIENRDICFFPNGKCTSLSNLKLSSLGGGGRGSDNNDGEDDEGNNDDQPQQQVISSSSSAVPNNSSSANNALVSLQRRNSTQGNYLLAPDETMVVFDSPNSAGNSVNNTSNAAGGGSSSAAEQSLLKIIQRFEALERQRSLSMMLDGNFSAFGGGGGGLANGAHHSSGSLPPLGKRTANMLTTTSARMNEEAEARCEELLRVIEVAKNEHQHLRKMVTITSKHLFEEFNRFATFVSDAELVLVAQKESLFTSSIHSSIIRSNDYIRLLTHSNTRLQAELDGVKARFVTMQYENSVAAPLQYHQQPLPTPQRDTTAASNAASASALNAATPLRTPSSIASAGDNMMSPQSAGPIVAADGTTTPFAPSQSRMQQQQQLVAHSATSARGSSPMRAQTQEYLQSVRQYLESKNHNSAQQNTPRRGTPSFGLGVRSQSPSAAAMSQHGATATMTPRH